MMYATVHEAFVSGLREAKRILGDGVSPLPEWKSFLNNDTIRLCDSSVRTHRPTNARCGIGGGSAGPEGKRKADDSLIIRV
jgi:hypothetical protein